MKSRISILALLLASAGVMAAGTALADGETLLKTKGCLGCHAFDKKKVGPAYNDVKAKFKGQAGAADKLAAEISAGHPPHPKVKVTKDEAKEAIEYILSK